MKITFDPEADASYLSLLGREERVGEVAESSELLSTPGNRGSVILHYDGLGRLIAVEVLGASAVLHPDILRDAPLP